MTQYKNPKVAEGVNVSATHPLKEFAQLLLGVVLIVAVITVVLHALAGYLVRFVPFQYETNMVQHLDFLEVEPSEQQVYLQQLAERLMVHMTLPEDMSITVHYSEEDTVNAFATLGGHVFFFKGLIDRLQSEDALATVMAHEIAHVAHRHPITALGKGVTLATIAAAVTGFSGSSAGERLIGQSLNMGLMKFSRDQESESDHSAITAIQAEYGHVQGALELFGLFATMDSSSQSAYALEMFRSHPFSDQRKANVLTIAKENGWQTEGQLTPLAFPN